MLQVSGTWDLRNVWDGPSPLMKTYMFFLLIACILGVVKLVRSWIVVPPFKEPGAEKGRVGVSALERTAFSLRQWGRLILLVCATFLMTVLANVSERLMDERVIGWFTILVVTRDFAQALTFGLWVVLFIYAIRWHILYRISRLRM